MFGWLFPKKGANSNFLDVEFTLIQTRGVIEVTYLSNVAVFANQTLASVENGISNNCKVLFAYFTDNIKKKECIIEQSTLAELSVILSVSLLHEAIEWNRRYRNKKQLIVEESEIKSFDFFNKVIRFLKKKYPLNYVGLATCLLDESQENMDTRLEYLNNFNNK